MSNKPFSKPKAVVIDDDRAIVAGVKMRLAHAGYEVVVAYEGEQGLSAIRSEKPDVVLLDVRMPDMDGLEVLREIRRDRAHETSPVIMLSASLQDQETALEAGAQYFLRKPYRSGDLLEAVSTVAPLGAS